MEGPSLDIKRLTGKNRGHWSKLLEKLDPYLTILKHDHCHFGKKIGQSADLTNKKLSGSTL